MPLVRLDKTLIFFVHIPKTGGASVDRYLSKVGNIALWTPGTMQWSKCSPQHIHAELHTRMIPRGFYQHGFTILRDPVARMISEYRYRAMRRQSDRALPEFDIWAIRMLQRYESNPYVLDNHIRPQSEFVSDGLKLFRYEDGLDPVFDWIDEIGGHAALPRKWHNRSSGPQVEPSKDVADLIREFYAQDIALLDQISSA
ncbi:sulfotransferase family 2 domain-containing protein [uncultured Tateyamaria sp.]|uniref:sulfotransferase family 2 domain-containing protein n=1 Tax=uncultured Tateyamaria sp. TaxID=455651 RepID=UPI002639EE0A|nr:sulfotransferase family 2 domain-containing protein [uncultured Tateyamaria sp.]